MLRAMRRTVVLTALCALSACTIDFPDATFACSGPGDCPADLVCVEGLCRVARASDAGCACALGEVCVGGRCVSTTTDADGDGVPTLRDCDDGDPRVGASAVRACASACADGREACADGVWGACDAPTDCACEGSATRSVACGNCGTKMQRCEDGTWRDVAACSGEGQCAAGAVDMMPPMCGSGGLCTSSRTCSATCSWGPYGAPSCSGCVDGTVQMEMQACGQCNTGTQTRTRTCSGCTFGAFGDWGTCTGTTGCVPGTIEMESQACGACGTQSRTRTCNSSCAFESWTAFGACSGETGVCTPGAVESEYTGCMLAPGEPGVRERTRTCDETCQWGPFGVYGPCM